MRHLILLLVVLLVACSSPSSNAVKLENLGDYQLESIQGENADFATLKSEAGVYIAEGILQNGVQNGMWINYSEEQENTIKTIANYVNGKLNGPYLEFNDRGQIDKRSNYINDQIHGLYAEYRFGRPQKEYMYKYGILDGVSKDYNVRGVLIKQTGYKNGELHGEILQYDEDGNVILKYTYKNGKKISGGIVEKEE